MQSVKNTGSSNGNTIQVISSQQKPHILKRIAIRTWSAVKNFFDSIRVFFVRLRYGRLSNEHKELIQRVAQRKKADANLLNGIQTTNIKDPAKVPEGMQDFYDQIVKFTDHMLETSFNEKLDCLDKQKAQAVLVQAKAAAKEFICKNLHTFAELDFSKLINSVVTILQKHAETVAKGEEKKANVLEALDDMIEKYEFIKKNPNTDRFSDQKKEEILEFGKNLEESGGKEQEIKRILATTATQYYADSGFCYPNIKAVIKPNPEQLNSTNPEENAYTHLAEGLYLAIFPPKSVEVNGETQIVDGLIYQIFKLQQNLNFSLNALIPPQIQSVTKQFSEEMFQVLVPGLVKSQIATALKSGFEMLIDPVKREELFASQVFPLIQEQLLIQIANTEISSCAKLFLNPQNDDLICQKMYEATKKSMVQYKTEFNKITSEHFKEIFMPEIKKIREKIAKDHPNNKRPTESSIADSIKKSVDGTSQQNNPLFGNLVQALVCNLGQFGGFTQFFFSWIKGFFSAAISNSVGEYQKDGTALAQQITLQLKKKNEELAKGPQNQPIIPNVNQQRTTASQEIEKTARLVFDLMQKKIQSAPYGTVSLLQFGAKQVIGQDHKYLSEVIQRIYNKMFMPVSTELNVPKAKDRITQSLLFKVVESVLSGLQDSAKNVQKNTSLLPLPKMTQVPSIVACL